MTEIFNKKELRERRQFLRCHSTEPEKLVWERIRKKQLHGVGFRRQVSIGGYVVDFYCPQLRLAIEIEGSSHERQETREYDVVREEAISELGIEILKYTNEEVQDSIDRVVADIRQKVVSLEKSKRTTFPLAKGEIQRGSQINENTS